MKQILNKIKNTTTNHLLIKEKVGNAYLTIARYENNLLNRLLLSWKNFNISNDKELYLVPEFKSVEGFYYPI